MQKTKASDIVLKGWMTPGHNERRKEWQKTENRLADVRRLLDNSWKRSTSNGKSARMKLKLIILKINSR